MTLQQLKYVLAIADKGSINEAAKSLFISQPSLSNSIKELEQELQITIFVRTNRGMTLTNDGYEFIGYLNVGADIMARSSDVGREVVDIIQGVMMFLIAADALLRGWRQSLIVKAAKAEEMEAAQK